MTPSPTPTATPTAKPFPGNIDCVIDAHGNAWLPAETMHSYRVVTWSGGSNDDSWTSPQPGGGDMLLVSQKRHNGWTSDHLAWCPDSASRSGDGTECLRTGGPTRIWPWYNTYCHASGQRFAGSWHPHDTGNSVRQATGYSYDIDGCPYRMDEWEFRSGTGTCRWVAPTHTPTPTATATPVCPSGQHTHGNTACHSDSYCTPHGNQPAPPHAKCPPPPTPTPTPFSLTPFQPANHGAGLACDGAGDEFDPDPLAAQGQWITAAAGDALEGGQACTATGAWLAADPWVQGWSFDPPSPSLSGQGGGNDVSVTLNALEPARKFTCAAVGQTAAMTNPDVDLAAVKVDFQGSSALAGFWGRLFQGASQSTKDPFCRGQDLTGGGTLQNFTLQQSRNEVSDPGEYHVSVRVCVAEAIGNRKACHEIAGDGGTQHPHLVMRGIAPSGTEE